MRIVFKSNQNKGFNAFTVIKGKNQNLKLEPVFIL